MKKTWTLALVALATFALFAAFDVAAAQHIATFVSQNPESLLLANAPAVLPEAIKAELDKISDKLKEHAEKVMAEHRNMSVSAKEQVDELLLKHGELQGRLASAEQILAKVNAGSGEDAPQTFGEQFVNSEDWKAFSGKATPRGRVDMQFNAAITTVTTDTDGAAGDLTTADRRPGVITIPERRMTVRDLITPGRTDSGLIEYVQETGFTNMAAAVAEGAAKPESSLKYDLVSTTAKVIAHYVKASRQILSDAPQLMSLIDGRLRYGLAYVEENQILNGDGTGQNLLGIVPQATAYAVPSGVTAPTGATKLIDMLRVAMLQAVLAEYPATGHVLNPIDWAKIEMAKDAEGRYLIGQPQGRIGATLWNLPVVETQAMAVDKFLTGAFKLGAQVFDRWLARVEVATENEDDFVKNMVTVLAEERLALAVYRPEAFVYGDFGDVA